LYWYSSIVFPGMDALRSQSRTLGSCRLMHTRPQRSRAACQSCFLNQEQLILRFINFAQWAPQSSD
jgi:hypothetical protein